MQGPGRTPKPPQPRPRPKPPPPSPTLPVLPSAAWSSPRAEQDEQQRTQHHADAPATFMQQPHVAVPGVGPPPSPPPPFPHSPTAQQASPAATAPLPSRVAEAPFTVADKDDGGVIGAAHWFFSTLFSLGDGGKGMATSGDKALALATLVILVMLAYGCWRALPVRRGSYDAVAARRSPSGAQLFGSDQGRAAARAGLLDEEDEEDSHEQHAKMNEEKRLNERVAARVEEALAHARRTAAEQGHDQRQQHVAQIERPRTYRHTHGP